VAQAGKLAQAVNTGTCPGKAGARSRLLFKDFTRRLSACTDVFRASQEYMRIYKFLYFGA